MDDEIAQQGGRWGMVEMISLLIFAPLFSQVRCAKVQNQ
jgi:hypothetical protein